MQSTAIESDDGDSEGNTNWGPVELSTASRLILMGWYRKAQQRVWRKSGRRKVPIPVDVSDDEGDGVPADWASEPVLFTDASKALAIRWLRTARARLQQRGGGTRVRGIHYR